MKIIISCDDYCCKFNGNFYLSNFGLVLVNRYLMVYNKIRIVLRVKEVLSESNLGKYKNVVNDGRIEIFEIPFFQGPRQYAEHIYEIKKKLNSVSDGCSMAILRLPSTIAFAVWGEIRKKIPYAVEIVANCYDMFKGNKNLFHKFLWYNLHCKTKKACVSAIGVSCVTRDYLQNYYTSLKKNAIFSHYSSIEMLPEFRTGPRLYPSKEIFNIILVASQVFLNSGKGHKLSLDVIKILKKRNVNVHLTLVGDDYFGGIKQVQDYAKSLEIEDQVICTGFVNTSRLKEFLLTSDIMILPTYAEGLPRVIIEAMALGLPCVTTPVSGNPELIDKEYLVNYTDTMGFADKIMKLVTNKTEYEKQSKTNFERSREYCKDVLDARRKQFFIQLKKLINKY